MQKYKMTRLAAYMVVAVGLAACGANGGGDGTDGSGGGGGGGGAGSACTPSDGVICTVQETLDDLTGGTPLSPVKDLVDALLDPTTGGLAAITGPLDSLTSSDEALGQLNDLVQALVSQNDSALDPVIAALNGVLGGAGGTGGNGAVPGVPALDATALCALPGIGPQLAAAAGSTCTGSGGSASPVDPAQLCAIPVLGPQLATAAGASCSGSTSPAAGGLITTVQDTLDQVAGGTPLTPVQDLVNTLVNPQTGALSPLTGQLEAVTSDAGALAQLNALVTALAGQNDSALTPLLQALNGVLSAGGAPTVPGIPALPGLPTGGGVPVVGDLVGALNDALPANPLTSGLCGILGC